MIQAPAPFSPWARRVENVCLAALALLGAAECAIAWLVP